MNNQFAIFFAFALVAYIVFDWRANDAENLVFLGKKWLELLEWVAFWR